MVVTLGSGLTEEAKAWELFVARNTKCRPADNPSDYVLIGSTYLDKNGFNKINDQEHDVVHGVQVIYGTFKTLKEMQDYVANYTGSEYMWPGNGDWKYTKIGTPFILTPLTDVANATIVHNSSMEFQGQLELNEQQKRIAEIESLKKRVRDRELEENRPIEKEELDVRIRWLEEDLKRRRSEIDQETSHLEKLLKMKESL